MNGNYMGEAQVPRTWTADSHAVSEWRSVREEEIVALLGRVKSLEAEVASLRRRECRWMDVRDELPPQGRQVFGVRINEKGRHVVVAMRMPIYPEDNIYDASTDPRYTTVGWGWFVNNTYRVDSEYLAYWCEIEPPKEQDT